MRYQQLVAFVGLSALWGSQWMLAAVLPQQPHLRTLAIQYGICALLLFPFVLGRGIWCRPGGSLIKTVIAGTGILCLPQILIFLSRNHLPNTLSLMPLACTPVILAVRGQFSIAISMCGFAGVLFLASTNFVIRAAQLPWLLLPIGAACLLAWSLGAEEKQLQGISLVECLFISASGSALLLSACSLMLEHEPATWSAMAAVELIASGVVTTAFGYLLFYWLLGKAGAGRVSMLQWTQALIAACEWAIFMRIPPDWTVIAGAILIVLALVAGFSDRDEGEGVLFEITQT